MDWCLAEWTWEDAVVEEPVNVVVPVTLCSVASQTDDTTIQGMKKKDICFGGAGFKRKYSKPNKGTEFNRIHRRKVAERVGIVLVQTEIMRFFGRTLTHNELICIARNVAKKNKLKIDRNATRYKEALMAWCSENLTAFKEVLHTTDPEILLGRELVDWKEDFEKEFEIASESDLDLDNV